MIKLQLAVAANRLHIVFFSTIGGILGGALGGVALVLLTDWLGK